MHIQQDTAAMTIAATAFYKPTDADILAVLKQRTGTMTYHLANIIRFDMRKPVQTEFVLRRLRALEKSGEVMRVKSTYARQLCWGLVKGGAA
jgi:hypothetical protein